MADASDMTTAAHIFKRRYSDRRVTDITMREHPTWHQIAKESGFNGVGLFYPINYSNPQGISGTFVDAKEGAESVKGVQLNATRRKKYGVITLDGEAMAASRGDKGAFYDLVTRTTDGILEELGDNLAFDLYRNGTGVRGRRTSAAGNVITLTEPGDVRNFKVGMTVIASANANGSSPRSGSTKVARVSRKAGKVTLEDAAAILLFANNDYLFRKGDPGTCMEGFESATPLGEPTSGDSFRGIDRSLDVEALAGTRLDDVGILIEDAFGDCAVEVSTIGKKVKLGALYPTNFQQVVKRLNAKVEYQSGGGTADYGFEFIMLHTAGGTVKLYSDPDCPLDRGRMFNPESHCVKHLEDLVHLVKDDGRPSLRSTDSDGIQVRARTMLNYIQYDTSPHGVISIAA